MTSRFLFGVGLTSVMFVSGCASKAPQAPVIPPPPSAETLSSIRDSFMKNDPTARVGLVVAVRDADKLVAVGDVQVADFAVGQAVTVADQSGVPLGTGRVVNIDKDLVIVKVEAPASGARAPVVGDLAVRVQ